SRAVRYGVRRGAGRRSTRRDERRRRRARDRRRALRHPRPPARSVGIERGDQDAAHRPIAARASRRHRARPRPRRQRSGDPDSAAARGARQHASAFDSRMTTRGTRVAAMTLGVAPMWVRAASTVIRRLPAGRYRAMNWIGKREVDPFWMHLPSDLGSLEYVCDLRDGLMREVCLTGRYEPQETALVRHLIRPRMTFDDVGAVLEYVSS